MYTKIAGELLQACVFHVSARALAAQALSLFRGSPRRDVRQALLQVLLVCTGCTGGNGFGRGSSLGHGEVSDSIYSLLPWIPYLS